MTKSQKQLYFYSPEGLALVKRPGAGATRFLRAATRILAQWDEGQVALYTTDLQGSVIRFARRDLCSMNYTVYGYDAEKTCASALRYCGQLKEPVTGHYLLGDGYRAFVTGWIMRFNAPDSLSPFREGGLNAYSYCAGDPVNRVDPTGHMLKSLFRRKTSREQAPRRCNRPVTPEPLELNSRRSANRPLPPEQLELNNRMSAKLKEHNGVVRLQRFEHSGRLTGAGWGGKINSMYEADSWSWKELDDVEIYALNMRHKWRDLDSNDIVALRDVEGLLKKIESNLPERTKGNERMHWRLKNGHYIRTDG